jgi:tetratricopeptide (TPR) repeat protein
MLDPQPPADNPRASRSRWLWYGGAAAGVVVAGAALTVWLWPAAAPPAVSDDDEELQQLLAVANPGYVGIDACAECHAKRAADFKTTRHFVACTTAKGVASPGFAPGRGRCETRLPGLRYEMSRSGDDFVATAVQGGPGGEQRTSYQIALVYGSANKRDERYFAWQGDTLIHLPLAWLYPQDCWGADTDNLRVISTPPSCLDCHNTWVAHIPETTYQYRRTDMLLGVTCERCHGPGRDHVAYHREHPKDRAHGILHPGTLSRDRLMDVCAQCHGNSKLRGRAFAYRPGQPLSTRYRVDRAAYREDESTTNQVQFLSESKCFQQSSRMTCISCHNPHLPTPPQFGCVTCHKPADCKDRPHQPEAVRADCTGCHMPQTVWMNSHYYTTPTAQYVPVAPRSEHRIAVYPHAKKAVMLAWLRKQSDAASRAEADRLAGELTQHWLAEADKFTAAGRLKSALGAYYEALRVADDPAVQKRMQPVIARQTELDDALATWANANHSPEEAVRLLTRILDLKPDDARAHGELGTLYATAGDSAKAVPHLQAVAKYDPCENSGLTRLAWLEDMAGRPAEALPLCAEADKIDPGDPSNHFVWGMALVKLERWAEAEGHFRKVLEYRPTHPGANRGLSEVLRHQGRAAEAVRFARRALRCGEPNDAEALLTLGEAYAAADRPAEARKTLEHALAAVGPSNAALAQTIRRRLNQLP